MPVASHIRPRNIYRGPHLANDLLNFGISDVTRDALHELGYDLDELVAQEEEPGLGKWWAGSARIVFHGFGRVCESAGRWVWHPL